MISAFGVVHTISKTRQDLVPPEGKPSKYTQRIEDVRAAARNKYSTPKPAVKATLKLIKSPK